MFGALVLDRIAGEVRSTDVVTIYHGGTCRRNLELMKKVPEPTRFSHTVGHDAVLSLRARARHHMLSFGRPGDQVGAQEHNESGRRFPSVRTPGPVVITIRYQLVRGATMKLEAEVSSATKIT